jgi:hypothetical protein
LSTAVIETLQGQSVPYTYTLSGAQTFTPETAFATFDGTGASGDFLACMSFLAQDGKRFMRVFPTTPVSGGDVADVTFAPFPGGIGAQAQGPPNIPFCAVEWDVTVPASTDYGLQFGDLSFIFENFYPAFYALDTGSGGLTSLFDGLNRFDTNWSALTPDGAAFTPNPGLLLLELQGTGWLDPVKPGTPGFATDATGESFETWLITAQNGIFDLYVIHNTDPANDIRVTGRANVWRLNAANPE